MERLEGVLTALVTPFRNAKVDEDALRALVEHQIESGIDGLVPCGTTGESITLTSTEYAQVVRAVVEQSRGRVPVFAGAGSNCTRHTIQLARAARAAGATGLLLVAPYYNRPTQAGLVAHYRAVLAEVPLPSVLYNIPSRTGVDVAPESIARLLELPELVAVKEATGNVLRSQQLVAAHGSRLAVLSGDDALTLAVLAVGGQGVISVTANAAPKQVVQVLRHFQAGHLANARAAHQRLLALHEVMFAETNPGPVKAALVHQARIQPEIRLPLVWPGQSCQQQVARLLDGLGLGG